MLTPLKRTFTRHWLIIVIALLLGWLTYWPHLAYQKKLGSADQGITKSFVNDDLYYLTRGQDVIDGHATLANPCFLEHKNDWPMQFWLPDNILSKPLAILGINVVNGYNFYSFLLPLIAALLIYSTIYVLVGSRKLAIIGVLFLQAGLFFEQGGRLPSPGLNFIFWLTLFNLLLAYLKNNKKLTGILATLNLGLLFYVYPYYWTFGIILLVLLIILGKICLADFKIKNYLYILLGALIIGSRYFWELWQTSRLPAYDEAMIRLGLLTTHFPSGLKITVLSLLLVTGLVILLKKKIIQLNSFFILLLAGVLSALIAVNQHVITGKNLEFSSHYWQISAFIFVCTAIYCLQYLLYRFCRLGIKRPLRKILLWLMIIWSAVVMGQAIRATGPIESPDFYRQNYAPVFNWLKANTAKDEVVYANQDLSVYLPIYTANNVYYHQTCTLFFLSDAEVQSRFAMQKYFDNLGTEDILKYERSIWGTRYINKYAHNQSKNKLRKIIGLKPVDYVRIPEAEIERVKTLLAEIKTLDFRTALRGYRADYLLWDKNSDPHWQLDRYDWLEQLYTNDNFTIFKIN
ncbi:MAG: hypothetical protein Q8P32_02480 [Candidatus Komeilibacteria bacterium]|nr:hypothetical protein [Candidatus Komeilibacteria bacterium]